MKEIKKKKKKNKKKKKKENTNNIWDTYITPPTGTLEGGRVM